MVEITPTKLLLKQIPIQIYGGVETFVNVEYVWQPDICDKCKVFGHSPLNCPKRSDQAPNPSYMDRNVTKHPIKPLKSKLASSSTQINKGSKFGTASKPRLNSYRPGAKSKEQTFKDKHAPIFEASIFYDQPPATSLNINTRANKFSSLSNLDNEPSLPESAPDQSASQDI